MKRLISFIIVIFGFSFAFAQTTSLSDSQYFAKYIEEIEKTQSFLTYMNKKSTLKKMGTETIEGSISGTLFYTVQIKGMGAEVILRYTNFSCTPGWTFDGDIIVTSNMKQDGTYVGTITVTGDMPSQVFYDDLLMKRGKLSGGNYYVQQNGGEKVAIPYTVFNELHEYKEKD